MRYFEFGHSLSRLSGSESNEIRCSYVIETQRWINLKEPLSGGYYRNGQAMNGVVRGSLKIVPTFGGILRSTSHHSLIGRMIKMNLRNQMLLILGIIISSFHFGCKAQSAKTKLSNSYGMQINYNLDKPSSTIELSGQLTEISGIAYHASSDAIYAVNDEQGKLYAIDKRNGNILADYDFGSKGDYEGLEIRDNVIYISESNGTVTVFDLVKKVKIEKLKNNLNSDNDIEGIGLGPDNSLLLLCKGKSLKGDKAEDVKHLYKIQNYGDGAVSKYLGIDIKAGIRQLESQTNQGDWLENLVINDRISRFAPSGLANHPITGEKYMVSARGALFLILDEREEIKYVHLLDPNQHVQAEGVTFDSDNRLYISNEGKNGKANIFVFDPISN